MRGAKVLTQEELTTLLSTSDQRLKVLMLTGLYFGTRVSEALRLKFGDFEGDVVRIKSLKGSNDRLLVIPPEFHTEVEKLKQWYVEKGCPVDDTTPLFLSQKKDKHGNCKPISTEHACYLIHRLRDKLKLDKRITAHSFRKCFTTRIFELTRYNLAQTAVYTGHKSLNSLQAYIETTQETTLTQELGWI